MNTSDITNTAIKLGLALFFGSRFKVIAGGALALMFLAVGAALVFRLLW